MDGGDPHLNDLQLVHFAQCIWLADNLRDLRVLRIDDPSGSVH